MAINDTSAESFSARILGVPAEATLEKVLDLLTARNLLNRVTKIETSDGVRLELAAAPAPVSAVEAARQEANRERTQADFERRMRTGAVGAFIRKDIPE